MMQLPYKVWNIVGIALYLVHLEMDEMSLNV